MTRPARPGRGAVEDAVRDMISRECARVDDLGAMIPGTDPDDGHGRHDGSGLHHPREPGRPLFHPNAWRFFRLLDLGWLGDDQILVGPGVATAQQRLDAGWELPWPSLTNPPGSDPGEGEPSGAAD